MYGKEKINLVLELHNQGKTYRKIAHELHMSLRDIRSIIKKSIDDAEGAQFHNLQEKEIEHHPHPKPPIYISKRSHALKLFSEDKKPLDVAIQLDLPAEEVCKLYQDYLKLTGFDELARVYEDIDYNLYTLLDLYKIMKESKTSHHEILQAVKYGNELPYLDRTCQALRDNIRTLHTEQDGLMNDLTLLRSEISNLVTRKRALTLDIQEKRKAFTI